MPRCVKWKRSKEMGATPGKCAVRLRMHETLSSEFTHQLACTASMSLTKFWARQIPKICGRILKGERGKGDIAVSENKQTKKKASFKFWLLDDSENDELTCSSATPIKIPATKVRLSCSHFSNCGTQPFTLM